MVTWCLVFPLTLLALGAADSQPAVPAAGDITLLADPIDGECLLAGDLTLHPGDRTQFVINHQDDGSCYLLDLQPSAAGFYLVSSGKTTAIGAPGELKRAGAAAKFALIRRSYRLAFVYDGAVVCRGWDGLLNNGKAGYVAGGAGVGDARLQPIGPIEAADDFVRQDDTRHMWTELSGTWDIKALRDDEQADAMEADKSANAFVYHVVSNGPAVSLAEKDTWFWDNYHIGCSARSLGRGATGLILLGQDDKNYVLFRWASAWANDAQGNRAQLIEMVNGQPRVLAEKPGGFIPDRWYHLDAGVCDGDIVCSIDGLPLLRGHSDRFGLGNPGVYSEGREGGYFDDVVIEDYESFKESFANLARWRAAEGDWSAGAQGTKCASSGVLASGRAQWRSYLCACDVTADRGAVGLEVARQTDGRAILFRAGLPGSPYAGKVQFVRLKPQGEEVLAETTAGLAPGKPHRLAASVDAGYLRGTLDGAAVLDVLDMDSQAGAIALYANQSPGAQFANLEVSFLKPKQAAHVTREFTKTSEHPEMGEWASTHAPWIPPPSLEPGATWWTKGDYFGDATVTFTLRFIGLRDGSVRVTLNGVPGDSKAGIHLLLSATKDSRTLKAQVLSGTRAIGESQLELADSSCRVEFSRKGKSVVLLINDKPVVAREL